MGCVISKMEKGRRGGASATIERGFGPPRSQCSPGTGALFCPMSHIRPESQSPPLVLGPCVRGDRGRVGVEMTNVETGAGIRVDHVAV